MGSSHDSFNQSPLGAFSESPLHARGGGVEASNVVYLICTSAGGVARYNAEFSFWQSVGSTGVVSNRLVWAEGFLFIGGVSAHVYRGDASGFEELDLDSGNIILNSDLINDNNSVVAGIEDNASGSVTYATYDDGAFEFSTVASNTVGNSEGYAAKAGGELYFVAGGGHLYHYDGTSTLVGKSPSGNPSGNEPIDADVLSDVIYIMGLYDGGSGPVFSTISKFDPDANTWELIDDTIIESIPSVGDDYKWKPETDGSMCVWNGAVYVPGYRRDSTTSSTNGLLKITASSIELILETDTRSVLAERIIGCKPVGDNLMIVGNFTEVTDPNALPSPVSQTATGVVLWDGAGGFTTLANQSGDVIDCLAIFGVDLEPDLDSPVGNELVSTAAYSRQLADDNGSTITKWRLAAGPSGMTLSAAGLLEWASPTKTGNPHSIRVYAANGTFYDVGAWNLYVHDTEPVITSMSDDSHGGGFYQRSTSLDSGDTPVTWSLIAGPAGASISSTTGTVTVFSSDTPFSWTIRATNGAGYDEESWTTT